MELKKPGRSRIWVIVATVLTVVIAVGAVGLAAVRSDNDEDTSAQRSPSPRALESDPDRLPLQVSVDDPAAFAVTFGAEDYDLEDGAVELPLRPDAPALITTTSQGGAELAAVAVRFAGYDGVPVAINTRSTAFAELISRPPFLTADPGALVVMHALATATPSFPDLETAVASGDDLAVASAVETVGEQTIEALLTLLGEVDPGYGLAGAALGSGTSVPVANPATLGDGIECPTNEPTALWGLCLRSSITGTALPAEGEVDVDVVNRSRGWQAIVEMNETTESLELAALVPPRRLAATDGGTALAVNLFRYVGTQVFDGLGGWLSDTVRGACENPVGNFFGDLIASTAELGTKWFTKEDVDYSCEDVTTFLSELTEAATAQFVDKVIGRVDDWVWDPEGHATAAAAVDAHATPTYMVTSGIGAEAVSSTTPHQAGDVRMLVTLLNAWTNYVEPAWSLSLGLKVDRGSSSDAEPRRMSSADLHKLLGKLAEGGALQHAADVAAALERGDLDAVTLFALEAWTEIATDRELVIAVFGLLIGETFEQVAKQVTKALKDAVQRLGTRANAVAFVVTVAADLIFGIPAIVIQQDAFANELRHMPSIASMPPLWWYVARDHHEVIIATNASILEQLTVDEVTIAPLLGRSWTGHYKRVYDWDTGEVLELEGFYPPFSPNTGYPGEDLTFFDGVFSEEYVDVAQPWITDVKPFALEPGAFVEAGVDGHTATFWTVTDAPLLAEVDGTVRGAWLIAAVLTDAHSPEPRWAICRYHVGVEGFTARVDAEYCDQAEHGAVGDTWAFRDFLWTVVDGDLYEWGTDAAETQGSVPGTGSVHEFHRRFAHEAGSGMLEPTYPDQRVSAPILATWTALDIGARIPSETEVLVASGCVPDGVGGWVCPDI